MRGSFEIGTKIRALSSVDHVTASTSSSSSSPSTYSCLAQSSPSPIFFSSACSPSLSGHDPANVPEMLRVQEFCVTKRRLASMGFPFDPNSSTLPVLPFTISVVHLVLFFPFLFPSNSFHFSILSINTSLCFSRNVVFYFSNCCRYDDKLISFRFWLKSFVERGI